MQHLDLLLQLQGEMFMGLLQDNLSISFASIFIVVMILVFTWGFRGCYVTDSVLTIYYLSRNGHRLTSVQ